VRRTELWKEEDTMYRLCRTANVSSGKLLEAIHWAKDISAHLSNKYATATVQTFTELFGSVTTLHWHLDFESLAAF
jgi:hypothetical protein